MVDSVKTAVTKILKKDKKKKESVDWLFLKEKYDLGLDLRRPYQELWTVNLAFLSGRQYSFFNSSAQRLQQIVTRKGRVRVVDNKILPRYRKQISRLIRNRPVMSVVPCTAELEDIESAKVGDKILKSFWRSNKMNTKLRILGSWIYSCGNGYLDDRWNPRLGPTKFDGTTISYSGDADCGVWSPFEVLVPTTGFGDSSLHDMPWMIKHKFRSLSYFANNYGKVGEEVMNEENAFVSFNSTMTHGSDAVRDSRLPGAMEIQLYVQPCPDYPNGVYLVGANGIILVKQDYPYTYYHMEQFKDIEIPGVYHGMATMESAIWLQKLWNRSLSDIAEFNRTMGRGKWLAPAGANMQENPDDSMGQVLNYTPRMGMKPEHVTIKGLPSTYTQILDLCIRGFMELFYQHEVSQGTNKSDIRSGEMVQLLLEQDDFGNIPTHAVFEEGLEAVMNRVLKRIQTGYTTERTMQIRGRGGEYEVFSFKGADLRNNTDVHVKKESSLPDSKVGRQNQVMSRFQSGLYGNPEDPEVRRQVANMLDDAVVENVFGDIYQDEQIARTENRTMVNQQAQYLINIYDNHQVHIAEHNRFRKTNKYQSMKYSKDKKQQKMFYVWEAIFHDHISQHQAILTSMRQQQIQEMAMAKGGG